MKKEQESIEAYKIVLEQIEKRISECGGLNKKFVNKYFSTMQQLKMGARMDMEEFETAILDNGLCGIDCSTFDMSELSQEEFEMIPFDTYTVFSDNQKRLFHPNEILERGKSFGLGISEIDTDLSGFHIAIKDQSFDYRTIDANVVEYKGKDVENEENEERYHGKTVTSLLASSSCGVAKNASIHFFSGIKTGQCLDDIIKYNKEKTEDERIKVISISQMLSEEEYSKKAELRKYGCELVCANDYNKDFHACIIGTDYFDPLIASEQDIEELSKQLPEKQREEGIKRMEQGKSAIKIPINRTYHQIGDDSNCYKYQAFDSTSWGIPQVAALLAIFKKQKKDLTYEEFVEIAKNTSKGTEFIINPVGIQHEIDEINKETQQEKLDIRKNAVVNLAKENDVVQEKESAKGAISSIEQQLSKENKNVENEK